MLLLLLLLLLLFTKVAQLTELSAYIAIAIARLFFLWFVHCLNLLDGVYVRTYVCSTLLAYSMIYVRTYLYLTSYGQLCSSMPCQWLR